MRALFIISFFLILQSVYPQASYSDSLKIALQQADNDSVRFTINKQLSEYFYDRERKKSAEFNEEALKIARKNGMDLDVSACLELKGYFLNKENQYGEALKCYIEAFKIAEDPANEERSWRKPTDADPYQFRMQELATLHHNLGHVLWSTGNDAEAIREFRVSLQYIDKALPSSFVSANMNIGAVYLNLNMLDSALVYEKKALRSKFSTYWPTVYNYLGSIYLGMGKTDSAHYYYHKGISLAKKRNKNSSMMICQMGLAQWHLAERNKDSSLYYASEFLRGFKEFQGNPLKDINISNAYELLFYAYQLQEQHDSSMKYLYLAFTSRDSLSRKKISNLTQYQNLTFNEQLRLEELENEKMQTQNRIRIYGLLSGLVFILIVAIILFRNTRQKQKANSVLQKTLSDLKSTQNQLIHAEKMASLGELTAGIAHEIQNPLNFVNNFSDVSADLIDEMDEELATGNIDEIKSISGILKQNLTKIQHHGQRASSIVKGMLEHSRTGNNEKQPTNINAMVDEYIRLAYHGMRAKDNAFQVDFKVELDKNIKEINVVGQDIARVVLNLINNAFQACDERRRNALSAEASAEADPNYKPLVVVNTRSLKDAVEIRVIDNGPGISENIMEKIFQPFFTTKPTGEGTGLGLSLAYDIITKGHGGELKMETQQGKGTEFIIQIPIV